MENKKFDNLDFSINKKTIKLWNELCGYYPTPEETFHTTVDKRLNYLRERLNEMELEKQYPELALIQKVKLCLLKLHIAQEDLANYYNNQVI